MTNFVTRTVSVPVIAVWFMCAFNAAALIGGSVLVLQVSKPKDTVRAKAIEIVNSYGEMRFRVSGETESGIRQSGSFAAYDENGEEILSLRSSDDRSTTLALGRSNSGGAGVELVVSREGVGSVFTFDGGGDPLVAIGKADTNSGTVVTFKNSIKQVEIGATESQGGIVAVCGSAGTPVAAMFGAPGEVGALCVFDGAVAQRGLPDTKSTRVFISANPDGGVLTILNASGVPIIESAGLSTGGGSFRCNSSLGQSAVSIGSSSEKIPTFELLAFDGSRLVGIGSYDGAYGSLALFGPESRPQFAAGGGVDGGRVVLFDSEGVATGQD